MATKKPFIKLLFFSSYFYPYVSGLTQYPYRVFTEGKLPITTTCLTFHHAKSLKNTEKINDKTTILRMPHLFRISKGFISPQSLLFFWNETKKNDLVIINLPSVEGLVLGVIARFQKKTLISLLHCEVLLPFSFSNCIINIFLNIAVFFQLFLSKKIIVYTTDYYQDKWMYRFFEKKMEVILPPIHTSLPDQEYLQRLKDMKKNYSLVIGFCGRIAAEKGIETLIESMSSIKNGILFIAGPTGKDVAGEETYFTKIKNQLKQKNIPHVFLGTLSGQKLTSFYRSIDILILPSINKTEAFGMVQVEAMWEGVPVVASNLPGVRIPIQLSKMGILSAPHNASELSNAIQYVLANKQTFSNTLLVNQAINVFDPKKTYEKILHIIQSNTTPNE